MRERIVIDCEKVNAEGSYAPYKVFSPDICNT